MSVESQSDLKNSLLVHVGYISAIAFTPDKDNSIIFEASKVGFVVERWWEDLLVPYLEKLEREKKNLELDCDQLQAALLKVEKQLKEAEDSLVELKKKETP